MASPDHPSRRAFLAGTLAGGLAACVRGPGVRTRRPAITHGAQVGDVQRGEALVWARCDEPARMIVEWATTASFAGAARVAGPVVGPATDHTGTVRLTGLPAGQRVAYRVWFEREAARGASAPVTGTFATPGAAPFRFAWTGDTCGQGFGRNPAWGGLLGYRALRAAQPAFLLHSGDLIYADNPILPEQRTHDGRVWTNVSSPRVARVAEELDDFRARFAYTLEDEHVRALAAEVPIVAQWDDHETRNNWWPGQVIDDPRYRRERSASVLAAHALRATREWVPIGGPTIHRVIHYGPLLDVIVVDLRAFRTPNDANTGDAGAMLGAAQARWLVDALTASRARWKVVACDQPLALVIEDGPPDARGGVRQEGYGNGAGPPRGRERELAGVLAELARRAVKSVVWLTADVHYAAAHHFDPARATGAAFDAFWELVAGPIHAGTFGPNPLDPTFGPEVVFQWAPAPGTGNLAPWDGHQSFGTIDVQPDHLRATLWGIDGAARFALDVPWVG